MEARFFHKKKKKKKGNCDIFSSQFRLFFLVITSLHLIILTELHDIDVQL